MNINNHVLSPDYSTPRGGLTLPAWYAAHNYTSNEVDSYRILLLGVKERDLTPWDEGLDEKGRTIAASTASPLCVVAGPGTGKTFTLMHRVARLLEEGVPGQDIFVSSFTRTAALDLRKSLQAIEGGAGLGVQSGTLHSFCFGLLGQAEVFALTGRVPRPLMKFEERFLLEDMAGEPVGGYRRCLATLEAFNAAWARLQSEDPGWPTDEADQAFQTRLLEWLRFHQSMLIGELVPEALRFIRDNPESPHKPHFQHVLVDEYQDLNRADQELVALLAQGGELTIVGDENQSIYSFKYANPEGITEFADNHVTETLDECRRCPSQVVELANSLIQNNPDRIDRVLTPRAGAPDGEILLVQWPTLDKEIEGISGFIHRRVQDNGVDPGKVLVLAPRRQIGYRIRDALNNLGTRAHSFFHEQALDGNPKELALSHAQQAFTVLTLLANRDDLVALCCWCGFGSNSLYSASWKHLRAYSDSNSEQAWKVLERLADGELTVPYTASLVTRFKLLREELSKLAVLRGTALLDALFPQGEPWAEPFRLLAGAITIDDYEAGYLLDEIRTAIIQPELPTDVDYVRVMSLHKSKGLTADLVVVVGCIEGLIPFLDPDATPAHRELLLREQRRLFYVAITRTTGTLVLSSEATLPRELAYRMGAQVQGGNATTASTITSRFAGELGATRPEFLTGDAFLERV